MVDTTDWKEVNYDEFAQDIGHKSSIQKTGNTFFIRRGDHVTGLSPEEYAWLSERFGPGAPKIAKTYGIK